MGGARIVRKEFWGGTLFMLISGGFVLCAWLIRAFLVGNSSVR